MNVMSGLTKIALPEEITVYLKKVDTMINEIKALGSTLSRVASKLNRLDAIYQEQQTTNYLLQRLIDQGGLTVREKVKM